MTVANLERIYPMKVYKKCRNVVEAIIFRRLGSLFNDKCIQNITK